MEALPQRPTCSLPLQRGASRTAALLPTEDRTEEACYVWTPASAAQRAAIALRLRPLVPLLFWPAVTGTAPQLLALWPTEGRLGLWTTAVLAGHPATSSATRQPLEVTKAAGLTVTKASRSGCTLEAVTPLTGAGPQLHVQTIDQVGVTVWTMSLA